MNRPQENRILRSPEISVRPFVRNDLRKDRLLFKRTSSFTVQKSSLPGVYKKAESWMLKGGSPFTQFSLENTAISLMNDHYLINDTRNYDLTPVANADSVDGVSSKLDLVINEDCIEPQLSRLTPRNVSLSSDKSYKVIDSQGPSHNNSIVCMAESEYEYEYEYICSDTPCVSVENDMIKCDADDDNIGSSCDDEDRHSSLEIGDAKENININSFSTYNELIEEIRNYQTRWISLFQPIIYASKGAIFSPLAFIIGPCELKSSGGGIGGATWQRNLCYNPRRYILAPYSTVCDVYLPGCSEEELIHDYYNGTVVRVLPDSREKGTKIMVDVRESVDPVNWVKLSPELQQSIFYRIMFMHWEVNLHHPLDQIGQPLIKLEAIDKDTGLHTISLLSDIIDPHDFYTSMSIQCQTSSKKEITDRMAKLGIKPNSDVKLNYFSKRIPINTLNEAILNEPTNKEEVEINVIFAGKDQLGFDMSQVAWKILRWKCETSPKEFQSNPTCPRSYSSFNQNSKNMNEFFDQSKIAAVMQCSENWSPHNDPPYEFFDRLTTFKEYENFEVHIPDLSNKYHKQIIEDISCLYSARRLDLLLESEPDCVELRNRLRIMLRSSKLDYIHDCLDNRVNKTLWKGRHSDRLHSAMVNSVMKGVQYGDGNQIGGCNCDICTLDATTLRLIDSNHSFAYFDQSSQESPNRALTSFCFIDYPGYGFSEGQPHHKNMVRQAYKTIIKSIHEIQKRYRDLYGRGCNVKLKFLGYSLGCAVALKVMAMIAKEYATFVAPDKLMNIPSTPNKGTTDLGKIRQKWLCRAALADQPDNDDDALSFPFDFVLSDNVEVDGELVQPVLIPTDESYRVTISNATLVAPFVNTEVIAGNIVANASSSIFSRVLKPVISNMIHDDVKWNNHTSLTELFYYKYIANSGGCRPHPLDDLTMSFISGTDDDLAGASSGLLLAYHSEMLRRGGNQYGVNDDMGVVFTPIDKGNHNNLLSYPNDIHVLRQVNAPARIHPLSRCIKRYI